MLDLLLTQDIYFVCIDWPSMCLAELMNMFNNLKINLLYWFDVIEFNKKVCMQIWKIN